MRLNKKEIATLVLAGTSLATIIAADIINVSNAHDNERKIIRDAFNDVIDSTVSDESARNTLKEQLNSMNIHELRKLIKTVDDMVH